MSFLMHLTILLASVETNEIESSSISTKTPVKFNLNSSLPVAKIVFTTETAGNYKLEVLNMLGQQVANLGEAFVDKGIHTMVWNGQNNAGFAVENGMYLVRLLSENGQALSKRILVAR